MFLKQRPHDGKKILGFGSGYFLTDYCPVPREAFTPAPKHSAPLSESQAVSVARELKLKLKLMPELEQVLESWS